MTKTNEITNSSEVKPFNFYIVTANFDMSSHGDLKTESFRHLKNANAFAQSMKEEFLDQIPYNGALDEDDSDHEYDEYFYFYGVSRCGENFVTVRVTQTSFMDDENFVSEEEISND